MTDKKPEVGMPATVHLHRDKHPYVVHSVSKGGFKVILAAIETVSGLTGHKPSRYVNDHPVWEHTYTEEEIAKLTIPGNPRTFAYRDRQGVYYLRGSRVTFGEAIYMHDLSI